MPAKKKATPAKKSVARKNAARQAKIDRRITKSTDTAKSRLAKTGREFDRKSLIWSMRQEGESFNRASGETLRDVQKKRIAKEKATAKPKKSLVRNRLQKKRKK